MIDAVSRTVSLLSPLATPVAVADGPAIAGVPIEFILFGLTLLGVALFHHHTLRVALIGLGTITAYKLAFTGFRFGQGLPGLGAHLGHEWVILANLFLLLLGFALLAQHFEKSEIPLVLPKFLPDDWKGAFAMLVVVFVLSSFLDNIAAAMIGGAMAHTLFRGRVHVGYLAAIVAASNAGGAGSVVGDTTTTMMWIAGVSPLSVLEAFVGSAVALLLFGVPAALQQQRYSPIVKDPPRGTHVDWTRAGIVALVLVAAISTNVVVNLRFSHAADRFPFIGVAVWLALLASLAVRKPDWKILPESVKGSVFLLSLVTCASMMPVDKLPHASAATTFGLGFLSAVFDNIPLTALSLKQGGYDWGFLAYAVGFGGSMIWFGSSAGVALSNLFPEAKSVGAWVRHGWYVGVAYVIGFAALALFVGWHPEAPRVPPRPPPIMSPTPIAPAVPVPVASPALQHGPTSATPAR
jgi:Na+/H+ antiporter NhaD/arsenite permease-like protein